MSYVSAAEAKININDDNVYDKHTITFTTQKRNIETSNPTDYASKSELTIENENNDTIEKVNDYGHVAATTSSSPKDENYWKFGLFKCASVYRANNTSEAPAANVKIYSCEFEIGGGDDTDGYVSKKYKLVPVLRKSDKTPGLFDIVNNFFYENVGSGTFGYRITGNTDPVAPKDDNPSTFSLRDPYYVAPSGVYAKLIAENELEIVADTEEVQGDDWVHFANVSEAYSHFNIVLPIVE